MFPRIPAAAPQILQGNTAFTSKIYQILSKESGNVFFSPFSLHVVLAMLYQGAREDTAKILAEVLQVPDLQSTAEGYKWILSDLRSIENITLRIANKIYVRQNEKFVEEFKTSVRNYFDSELEVLDFANNVETAKRINKWVEKKTGEKINQVVDEQLISDDTALFLLNTIYFESEWKEKFRRNETVTQDFYLDEQQVVKVEMMKGRKRCSYKNDEALNAKTVILSYKGKGIVMVIIIPKEKNGIKDLEAKLSNLNLADVITTGLHRVNVDLSLPKFKFSSSIKMESVVQELGLDIIFDKCTADFTGMLVTRSRDRLCVDKILQKACINVNEEGSEAAVVTVVKYAKMWQSGTCY